MQRSKHSITSNKTVTKWTSMHYKIPGHKITEAYSLSQCLSTSKHRRTSFLLGTGSHCGALTSAVSKNVMPASMALDTISFAVWKSQSSNIDTVRKWKAAMHNWAWTTWNPGGNVSKEKHQTGLPGKCALKEYKFLRKCLDWKRTVQLHKNVQLPASTNDIWLGGRERNANSKNATTKVASKFLANLPEIPAILFYHKEAEDSHRELSHDRTYCAQR